ncbi:ABC transporter ATP-binding protein [Cupriavidus necator]|uniref:ABC transporter ATP-binding protein n=2 Tax=Cupriavidus necator TaxID=106590 RepID=UPI00129E2FFC|nr:ABC transporter ATP-binding protein [Cupriavidus necator]
MFELKSLCTEFHTSRGRLHAVDRLDLIIHRGEVVALVGESGSGKSVTAFSIMGLVRPPGRVASGEILLRGKNLLSLNDREWRDIRGDRIAMIFQEPMTSLNPLFTVGEQISESLRRHRELGRAAANKRAVELLDLVRISEPQRRAKEYPHRLSGGMRQRVMIAMALACNPDLLIADEPTTALDVTVQAQIMNLLGELRREFGMAILLITHDLGIVAEHADRVAVMYAGRKVEEADVESIFDDPLHPYTRGLLESIAHGDTAGERLQEIPGMVPALHELPPGCAFADRCSNVTKRCRIEIPALTPDKSGTRAFACFNPVAAIEVL